MKPPCSTAHSPAAEGDTPCNRVLLSDSTHLRAEISRLPLGVFAFVTLILGMAAVSIRLQKAGFEVGRRLNETVHGGPQQHIPGTMLACGRSEVLRAGGGVQTRFLQGTTAGLVSHPYCVRPHHVRPRTDGPGLNPHNVAQLQEIFLGADRLHSLQMIEHCTQR
jgi:hypothetical protein